MEKWVAWLDSGLYTGLNDNGSHCLTAYALSLLSAYGVVVHGLSLCTPLTWTNSGYLGKTDALEANTRAGHHHSTKR